MYNEIDDDSTDVPMQYYTLHEAVAANDPEAVKVMLAQSQNLQDTLSDRDGDAYTPLMTAARKNALKTLEILLEAGADTTQEYWSYKRTQGETALYFAAVKGHSDVITTILHKDPRSLDIVNNRGWSPLMAAVANIIPGHTPDEQKAQRELAATRLIEAGANLELCSKKSGSTVLMMAAGRGLEDMTRLLIEKGADPAVTDQQGKNAAHYAYDAGNQELGQYLEGVIAAAAQKSGASPQSQINQVSSLTPMQPEGPGQSAKI